MSKLSKELFLQPILKGQRFDDHAIPVEVLAEFNAYKLLILEVAKFLFKKNNIQLEKEQKKYIIKYSNLIID